jgi:photosystem II stability/assembly factor-like uncharacterized protein
MLIIMKAIRSRFGTLAICFFSLFWAATGINAQVPSYIEVLGQQPADAPFSDVRAAIEKHFNRFESQAEKNKNGYKQWKRWEWFAQSHLDPDGRVGNWTQRQEEAIAALDALPQLQNANGSWSSTGPSSISNGEDFLGRTESVAFHPTDPNTIYVGTATGGLWRTTNLGSTWVSLTDHLPSLSVASVVVQQNNPNIIYILTGDGDGGLNWGYYVKERSSGVFKSTDGGATWQTTGLNWNRPDADRYGYKLIQSPTNSNLLLAATSNGIWRTTDGGSNWVQELTGQYTDVVFRPGDANYVAAIEYGSSTLRTSSNGGDTWTPRSIPSSSITTTRSMLAVTPAATGNVYILMGRQGNESIRGYYRFQWSDNSFTLITNSTNLFGGATDGTGDGGFPWWAIAVAVSPTNSNIHLAGGVIGRRSTDGGVTWTAAHPAQMHVDLHGYYYNPLDGSVYCTHDGGISRSTNNGVAWANIGTALRITQYYRISTSPVNEFAVLGGTQDNGHHYRTSLTSAFKWTLTCCDGMDNAIDPTNDQIIYMCSQDGGLNRSTDGGNNWTGISPGGSTWVAPIALHTTTPTTIFFAGNAGIFRSTASGTSGWVNIGADGRAAMAQGTSNTSRFYAAGGTDEKNMRTLRRSDNINDAAPTWTTISGNTGWPTGIVNNTQISGLAVNPRNSNEIWVTFSGYNDGKKVYRSTDAGDNWTNMSGALANLPVHVIKFQDQGANNGNYQVYIGTDIGVFYRSNSLSNWAFFSNGLPRVMVTDLELNGTYLYAGTYGRGIWRTDPYGNCVASATYSATYNEERVFQASGTITSTSTMLGALGTNVQMRAGSYVQLNPGFHAQSGSVYNATVGPCNAVLPLSAKTGKRADAEPD